MTGQRGVGVIIAAYNARDSVGRAVRSALAEEFVQEVVVVDDGSHDDTPTSARQADDGTGRLSVIALASNSGPPKARNTALEHSRAPYFCVLDADDYFLPGRIGRLLASTDSAWDMLADDVILVSGDVTDRELINLCQAKPFDGGSLDLTKFVSGCIPRRGKVRRELAYLKPLVRRDFVERHGLRYDETFLRLGDDYAFYTKALIAGARFRLAGACGYVAVERANSLSTRWTLTDLQSMLAFDDNVLAGCAQLTKQERSVFTAHRRNLEHWVDYMAVADRKQQRGRLAALAMLPQMPSSASYILLRTALDKLVALPAKLGVQRTENRPGKMRLVIGKAPRE